MHSRHSQCPFIILSAFICNRHLPARCWTPDKIDEIINFGNRVYSHALSYGSIPNTRCLLVFDLPVVAKSFDSSLLTIKYGNEYSGFFNGSVVEWPCTYSLNDSLVNVFSIPSKSHALCMRHTQFDSFSRSHASKENSHAFKKFLRKVPI